jgi:hypothetical protein
MLCAAALSAMFAAHAHATPAPQTVTAKRAK